MVVRARTLVVAVAVLIVFSDVGSVNAETHDVTPAVRGSSRSFGETANYGLGTLAQPCEPVSASANIANPPPVRVSPPPPPPPPPAPVQSSPAASAPVPKPSAANPEPAPGKPPSSVKSAKAEPDNGTSSTKETVKKDDRKEPDSKVASAGVDGKAVYEEKCLSCHTAGEKDFAKSYDSLTGANGVMKMPKGGSLTPDELSALKNLFKPAAAE